MTISSMTGFARASGSLGENSWSWEIKCVNSRGLDLRCRLQGGLEKLESSVREAVTNRFHRGAVSLHLSLTRPKANLEIKINKDFLNSVLAVADELSQRIKAAPLAVENLLSIRGVMDTIEVEASGEDHKALEVRILKTLEEALDALENDRGTEGKRLVHILNNQVNTIATLTSKASSIALNQPAALKLRLKQQISE